MLCNVRACLFSKNRIFRLCAGKGHCKKGHCGGMNLIELNFMENLEGEKGNGALGVK